MGTLLDIIYNRSPVFIQNIMTSGYGYLIKSRRYGGNFSRFLANIEKSQYLSSEELKQLQLNKLHIMLMHAYENVPYYSKLFKKLQLRPNDIKDIRDLGKIPILEKEAVRDNPEEFRARNISKLEILKYATGGTTGTPLTIYLTRETLQYNYAMYESRCRRWAGVKLGERTATFLGKRVVPTGTVSPPFWRYNKALNQVYFSSFHMSEKNLFYYIQALKKFQPRIVVGYVSTIYTLAKYMADYGVKGIKPKAILVSSETLFDWQKRLIELQFGCRVFNAYSQAEYAGFISECEHGGLHISPEYGIIEFIGDNSSKQMICTGLFNFAMPFIRYRTCDVAIPMDKKCACGRDLALVKSIEGRSDDMLVTPDGSMISPASMSLAFEFAKNIKEVQIIQDSPEKITLRIVRKPSYSQFNHNFIIDEVQRRLGSSIRIESEFVEKIPRTRIGKFRFIVSNLGKT
ncbi:phenylacetate--CoA ligase family protein [candidate division WOR-3 bacterium]|nr:phenylacetate--CoA ligase family protein [candidate division WOR-3 bacterium]